MRNRIVLLILAGLLTISLAGCKNETSTPNTAKKDAESESMESSIPDYMEKGDTVAKVDTAVKDNAGAVKEDETEKADEVVKTTEKETMETEAEKVQMSVTVKETVENTGQNVKNPETETNTVVTGQPETSKPVETKPIENTEPADTQTSSEQPKTEDVTVQAPSDVSSEVSSEMTTEHKATAADTKAVADKVIEYINAYRSTPATKLTGLTAYAEYRSRQLVYNFAHDTADERAAATALQYGTYIDPTQYGISGEAYYTAGAREAIAKAGYTGTVDEVAEGLALLVKNSTGHWAYVGSSDYSYIAVGVTYESGMWYCDIAMAMENTDN